LSPEFRIAETDTFRKEISRPQFRRIYEKIKNYVYPQLRENPFFGRNIKRLKGDWSDTFRYRIGDYRLFYTISAVEILVLILAIDHRKDAYR
jgi:mRNA interferase RelE/StbE